MMKENMEKFEKIEKIDIKRLLITMSLPAMLSMIVQALYNIVDSIFVAHISEKALTALSLAFPIQMVIISIFVGLGIGVNSYMSRKFGEGKTDEAVNTAEHGLFLGLTIGSLMAILAFIVPQHFFKLFTDDPIVLDYAIQYTRIIMIFSFGSIITEVCSNILRSTGDMVSAMKIQLLGAITNIVLDPFLIFGFFFFPELGVVGAAIATIIGQLTAMTYALNLVLKNKNGLELKLSKFHYSKNITIEIFRVGLPAIFMQLMSSVMVTGINIILAAFSGTAVAVFGAYFKIQSFIYMPVFGITMGMMPIVGYNFGAGNRTRVNETVKYAIVYASMIMLLGTVLFNFFPKQLLAMFNSSVEMSQLGVTCLRIISLGYVFSGIVIIFSTYFQALGRGFNSLIISFARQLVFLLPIAFYLSKVMGVTGVWVAFPVSEVLTFIIGIVFYIKTSRVINLGLDKQFSKYA